VLILRHAKGVRKLRVFEKWKSEVFFFQFRVLLHLECQNAY
jgi:hypothetical protein